MEIDARPGLVRLPHAPRLGRGQLLSALPSRRNLLSPLGEIDGHMLRNFCPKTNGRVTKRRTTETSPAVSPHVLRRTTVDPHPIARGSEAHLAGADSPSTHIGAASPHATSGETEETSDTKIIGANTRDDECQQRQGARPQTRCVLSRQPHPYSSPRVPSVRRTIRVIPMRRTTLLRNVPRRVPRQFAEGQHFFTTLLFTC